MELTIQHHEYSMQHPSLTIYKDNQPISLLWNFPSTFKTALIRPLLKKPSLDHKFLKNYLPVSKTISIKTSRAHCFFQDFAFSSEQQHS